MRLHLTLLFILLFAGAAPASPMPGWVFRVMKTDHFEIIYRTEQKALAKRYALAAEQAYELLIPIFKEAPANTIIVISDETDSSNGLATFLPYPIIYVYPVLPTTLDSIDEYGDWALEMIVHEYTHILNMYPSHGFYLPLRWIFGSVVRPNAILPKWYLEGLAVNLESRLTDHGRLRTSETGAAARVLVQNDLLRGEKIDRINEQDISSWPYGGRPYMFGGWWWNQVQAEKGPGVIETWNQNFSRRIPFLLNGPMREQTGRSAQSLLSSAHADLEKQVAAQIATLKKSPLQPSTPLVTEEGEQSVFALSPNGMRFVYWVNRAQGKGSTVYFKQRIAAAEPLNSLTSLKLFKGGFSLRVHWMGDEKFVYDQIDLRKPRVSYRDLYLYDFLTGESKRLTTGMRAQEGSPSPNGNKIAYIQNDGGRNRLMLLDLATGESKGLVSSGFTQRLSSPEFLSDTELLFIARNMKGKEQIHLYDLVSKKVRSWNEELASVQHMHMTSKGLLATNADSGVRNVFLVNAAKGASQALSNTVTDIQTADYDPATNSILASVLTGGGRRLVAFPYDAYSPPAIEPLKVDPPPKITTAKVKIRDESYLPIEYLLPHYWIPFIYSVEGGALLQGTSDGSDPAGRNKYSIFGTYDTVTKKPGYGISYINSSLPTDIGVNFAKTVSYLGASQHVIENQGGGVTLTNDWPFDNRFTHWSVGGQINDTESSTIKYKRRGPTAGIQYSRLDHPLNDGIGWHASLSHEEFVGPVTDGFTAYGHTSFHLAENIAAGSGGILLHTRGAFAPKMRMGDVTDLGDRSVGGNYLVSLTNSDYLLRGYPSGAFVGRKILNANLEYSIPLWKTLGGTGTLPLFFRNLDLALFYDTLSVDGGGWDVHRLRYIRSYLSRYYSGAGAELRFNTTAAYHLPISLILGGYYGFTEPFGGGFTPFIGLGLGGLGALENKTP